MLPSHVTFPPSTVDWNNAEKTSQHIFTSFVSYFTQLCQVSYHFFLIFIPIYFNQPYIKSILNLPSYCPYFKSPLLLLSSCRIITLHFPLGIIHLNKVEKMMCLLNLHSTLCRQLVLTGFTAVILDPISSAQNLLPSFFFFILDFQTERIADKIFASLLLVWERQCLKYWS